MSEPSRSGMRARSGPNWLAGTLWLGTKDMRRGWVAYPLTALVLLFLGLLVMPSLSGVFALQGFGAQGQRLEDFFNAFFVDSIFLVICASLALSRGSFRLLIFRDLPIPASSLVGARVVSLLFALISNVPAFFLPAVFLDLGGLGASYIWFAGIWIGYSLVASGLVLLVGLSEGGRTYVLISVSLAILLVLTLALVNWTVGFSLVNGTVELARDYGALPAVLSILMGAAAFAVLSLVTADRLQKRGFSS